MAKHKIVLNPTDAPLIHSTSYRTGPKQQEHEWEEVVRMKKADIVDPAVAEWASPIEIVPKKGGIFRFFVN